MASIVLNLVDPLTLDTYRLPIYNLPCCGQSLGSDSLVHLGRWLESGRYEKPCPLCRQRITREVVRNRVLEGVVEAAARALVPPVVDRPPAAMSAEPMQPVTAFSRPSASSVGTVERYLAAVDVACALAEARGRQAAALEARAALPTVARPPATAAAGPERPATSGAGASSTVDHPSAAAVARPEESAASGAGAASTFDIIAPLPRVRAPGPKFNAFSNISNFFIYMPDLNPYPLHKAACGEDQEGMRVALLLSDESGVNDLGDELWTPLHMAAAHGSLPVLQELLKDRRVNPNCLGALDLTPVQVAAARGTREKLRALLDDPKVDRNVRIPLLCVAAANGNRETFQELLAYPEANLDSIERGVGFKTLLDYAIDGNSFEILQFLIGDARVGRGLVDGALSKAVRRFLNLVILKRPFIFGVKSELELVGEPILTIIRMLRDCPKASYKRWRDELSRYGENSLPEFYDVKAEVLDVIFKSRSTCTIS